MAQIAQHGNLNCELGFFHPFRIIEIFDVARHSGAE